jgi:hypothetical protein
MAGHAYTPSEGTAARERALGQQMTTIGAILFVVGAIGTVLATLLKVVWLGILGAPIGFLSWIAVIAGIVSFVIGFNKIKAARRFGGN